jgi:hypothetical protein
MNELAKIKQRILERIETYIGDIEFAEEQELTEDEKTIFKSVKNIILEEFDRITPSNTEHIIKDTIKEYLDKPHDDVIELLLTLSKDLCERIRSEELSEKVVHLNAENKPRLSKPAFVVLDHVLKEHEEHEDRFTTFCDGKHQRITTKQLMRELDKLYDYYYGGKDD